MACLIRFRSDKIWFQGRIGNGYTNRYSHCCCPPQPSDCPRLLFKETGNHNSEFGWQSGLPLSLSPSSNAILHVRILVPMDDYWRARDGNLGNLVFLTLAWAAARNGSAYKMGLFLRM